MFVAVRRAELLRASAWLPPPSETITSESRLAPSHVGCPGAAVAKPCKRTHSAKRHHRVICAQRASPTSPHIRKAKSSIILLFLQRPLSRRLQPANSHQRTNEINAEWRPHEALCSASRCRWSHNTHSHCQTCHCFAKHRRARRARHTLRPAR